MEEGLSGVKYLIVGARGQLGREFVKALPEAYALGKEELDVTNFGKVLEVMRALRPDVVINCSAYNYVDRAEEEFERAYVVNSLGPMYLAIACREIGAFLVHFSTDYVFDGEKTAPYTEEDRPNPLSKYALSKYLGEINVESVLEGKYLIFRTSWVYGEGRQNFLYKLRQWAEGSECVRVACDEFSVPTSTRTIVEVTLLAIKAGLTGLYHLVNSSYASRYEWAKEYFRIAGIKKFIYPAYQHEFNLPARRPKWSVMSNEEISRNLSINIRTWKEELELAIKNMRTQ